MKIKLFFVAIIQIFITFQLFAQKDEVLMSINDKPVTVSEFMRIYKKNNPTIGDSTKTLQEYIDLFVNFKLKVCEAENLKMDTAQSFIQELSGYRKQLVKPYLIDQGTVDSLILVAYERMKFEVSASHILIKLAEDALPKDTLTAYNKALKIRGMILKGEDFEKVAKETSDDPSARNNGGSLGYFTAFQMVYPFEDFCFNHNIGDVSMPVRTQFGYHIIKLTDKRPSQGQIRVAHIMIMTPKEMNADDVKKAETKIKEVYQKLKDGGDFKKLTEEYSEDKGSSGNGGELPWFGTGRMIPDFESAAFKIKDIDEFTEPIKTSFGWHIIKLLERKGLEPFDKLKGDIKSKLSRDVRNDAGKVSLIQKLKKEYHYTVFTTKVKKTEVSNLDDFYAVVDTNIFHGNWDINKAQSLKKPLFKILDSTYSQQKFAIYLASIKSKTKVGDVKMYVNELFNKFVDDKILELEEIRLELKYPEFRNLMTEYHDGILLFDLTDKMVWTKAVKDTIGLENFYQKNKTNYMWDERLDAVIYQVKNEKILKDAEKNFIDGQKRNIALKDIFAKINKKDTANIKFVEGKVYVKGDNPEIDKIFNGIGKNEIKKDQKIITNPASNKLVLINEYKAPELKSLSDAKGIITADYQNYLEAEWVKELRKKYKVNINSDVLSKLK